MNKLLFSLLCCLCSGMSYGQPEGRNRKVDSILSVLPSLKTDSAIINAFIEASGACRNSSPELGVQYGEKALQKALALRWSEAIARSLTCVAESQILAGDNDKACRNSISALSFTGNKKTISNLYRNLSAALRSKSDYSKALEYGFKALSLSEELKDSIGMVRAYTLIGTIYYSTDDSDDFDKALHYYNKALRLSTRLKARPEMISALQKTGALYAASGKDSAATGFFDKALELSLAENDQLGIIMNHYASASLHLKAGRLEKALADIRAAKLLAEQIHNDNYYATMIDMEASIYNSMSAKANGPERLKLLGHSEQLLLDAINLNQGNPFRLVKNYKHLSELYELKGDYRQSKAAYVTYSDLRDSIFSISSRETIQSLESQQVIDLKNKEIQLHKVSLDLKEKQTWFLACGILLCAIIVLLLIRQNRSRKRSNEQLHRLNAELEEANRIKARFFSILNHDLRSPVSNLIHFLHLKQEDPELLTETHRHAMEQEVVAAAENLLVSMEDLLLWSKSQMQNFRPFPKRLAVAQVFDDLKLHFSGHQQVEIRFWQEQEIYLLCDPDYLKTIMRNLTANAIRALEKTPEPVIIWKAREENDFLCLSITDNGPGGTVEQFRALYDDTQVIGIKSGLGLHLIRDLAKATGCRITVEHNAGAGMKISLRFSKSEKQL